MENPLSDLIMQLAAQSGPRGALFAGRRIPQGQTPDIAALLMQMPMDIPEEGYGMLPSINPLAIAAGAKGTVMPTMSEAMRNYYIGAASAARQFEEQKRRK